MTDRDPAGNTHRRSPIGPARVESARWSLGPLLDLTCTTMDMDLVLLTEVADGLEQVLRAAGAWPGLDPADLIGRSLALPDTFCQRLLQETLPPFVGDVERDPTTAGLRLARALGVKAWIGTRLPTSGARIYVLCCLARETRPNLGRRDVLALSTLAISLSNQLDTSSIGP
jgi:GAF domain-containing protein